MAESLEIAQPRCEYRDNPLGIDVAQPRLSWQLVSERRGARQAAYRIAAAASASALADDAGLLWDSGKVESDQSVQVPYAGPALASGQRVFWQVRVWDDAGNEAASAPAWWEMGLLERGEWQGQWIGGLELGGPFTTSPAPFVRAEFTLDRPVAQARLYATALGVYEAHINGEKVGDDVLTPGWTDYAKRVQYQVYDVTGMLKQGENAIGAILGDGWYAGYVGWRARQRYGDTPKFLANLVVTYDDGSSDVFATGDSWKTAYGPIISSDIQMGEHYDARREMPGWDTAGFDDGKWRTVSLFPDPGIAFSAMVGPTVRRTVELKPGTSSHDASLFNNPRWVFDMGQNMVGWLRLKISAPAGTTITLRHAEVLNPDGTIYTTNLRRAQQTDHYTAKGEGEEIWEPRFTFHGFRYVELSGFAGTPTDETLTGIVLHSDMPQTMRFESSDPLINQLQHNIEWGQRGNFVDVPTDCPQRDERLGWTGDAQVFIRTAAYNFDVSGFFTKWTRDLEDSQTAKGEFPMVSPNPGVADVDGGPAWADAGVICPWTIYQCYGDKQILIDRYASMRRYVDFLNQTSRDGERNYVGYDGWQGFGDWLALDGSTDRFGITPKGLIGTAFFSYSSRLLSRIATILGHHEDAARYARYADTARDAFQRVYVTPGGLVAGGTQACYVLALYFGLLPEAARPAAIETLVRDIKMRGNHLSTGFVATPYISRVLSDNGKTDVAYTLLKQTTWPSWLYSVTQGATTIWERWDGWTHDRGFQDPGMNSFNHYAYGAIGAWMYAVVAGIDVDDEQPGYKHIIMRPQPGGNFSHVAAELKGPYGTIRSAWKQNNGFEWDITVPANSSALVAVPAAEGAAVREGDGPADQAEGVRFLRHENGAAVYEVGAGSYHFAVEAGA
jgi:alpha-L-rhamnosidase